MELDVHITNDGDVSRLQLSEAVDSIPVIDEVATNARVENVIYKSDIMSYTHDIVSCDLSQDATVEIAEAEDIYPRGSCGLYDPVVNDHDPVLQPDDSDRPSQPQTEEKLRDLEIKSSLLTTAIDNTNKSIEEYKEEIGIDISEDMKILDLKNTEHILSKIVEEAVPDKIITIQIKSMTTNGYDRIESEFEEEEYKNSKMEEEWKKIHKQVEDNNEDVNTLSESINKNEVDIESQEAVNIDRQGNIIEPCEDDKPITKDIEINTDSEETKKSIETKEVISQTQIVPIIPETISFDLGTKYNTIQTEGLESKSSDAESKSFEMNTEGRELGTCDSEINSAEIKKGTTEENTSAPKINYAEIKTEFLELENTEPEIQTFEFEIAADSTIASEKLIESNETANKGDLLFDFNSVQFSPETLQETPREQKTVKVQEINEETATKCLTERNEAVNEEENIAEVSEESIISSEAHDLGHIESNDHMDDTVDTLNSTKIIPIVESLRHSEVIRALNEEFEERSKKEKKVEMRKRSTFMQKPQRPVPNQKDVEKEFKDPLTSKTIINETELPIEIDDRRVTEEVPKVLEAVDSLLKGDISVPETEEKAEEETEMKGETEQNKLAEQLMKSVKSTVDPNATLEQQVSQMQAQLAALAQLPNVIQQTIDMVTQQLIQMREEITKQAEEKSRFNKFKLKPIPRGSGVGKPSPMFGRLHPEHRPMFLPACWKWRGSKEDYNEQLIAETLHSQSELLQGNVIGSSSEHVLPPSDERINFMKYKKPPVSLDHLERSDVYKVVHNVEQAPVKRVELLAPVIAEADYRERCRSATPSKERIEELEP